MSKAILIRRWLSPSDNRKSKNQNRKLAGVVALVAFAMCGTVAHAQQPTKIPLIGVLAGGSVASDSARIEALRQGLRDLGYVEGKNIRIEYRYAEGKTDRLRELAPDIARLKADIIVTAGPAATRAAKEATNTIPI